MTVYEKLSKADQKTYTKMSSSIIVVSKNK